MTFRSILSVVALAFLAPIVEAQEPVGTQFQINTYTTDYQVRSSAAVAADGSFVVTWESGPGGYPAFEDIRARRFNADGSPRGSDFQVNSFTGTQQRYSAVASAPDGAFTVVWQSTASPGSDTDNESIQGRRFASDGSAIGSQFQINTSTVGSQVSPSIDVGPTGDFVVTWSGSFAQWAQRFASDGTALGAEILVNPITDGQRAGQARWAPDGGFMVAWEAFGNSGGSDTSERSAQAVRYDSSGNQVGAQLQLNTYTTGIQGSPDVAFFDDGSFVAVWHGDGSLGDDTSDFSVQAQRFDADRNPVGSQFQVNTQTAFSQSGPSVVPVGDDGFFVVWRNLDNPDIFNLISSVQGRRFDRDGSAIGGQFQIPTYTTGSEYFPRVAANGQGEFLVTWSGTGSAEGDDSQTSIHGQRFSFGIFADGFESGDTSAWSSTNP